MRLQHNGFMLLESVGEIIAVKGMRLQHNSRFSRNRGILIIAVKGMRLQHNYWVMICAEIPL